MAKDKAVRAPRTRTEDLPDGDARLARIEAFRTRMNKSGDVAVVRAAELKQFGRLSTGSPTWDVILGGGFKINCAHEIIANESNGKTTLLLQVIKQAQRVDPQFQTIWGASEPYDVEYAALIGVDSTRVTIVPNSQMEAMFQTLLDAQGDDVFDMMVLDSYPTLVPIAQLEKDMSEATMTEGARLMSRFLAKWQYGGNKAGVGLGRPLTLFVINQWREKPGIPFGSPLYTPGGKHKNYVYASRIELQRRSDVKDGDRVVGLEILMKVIKNKTFPPKRSASTKYYFTTCGLNVAGSYNIFEGMIGLALLYDIIDKSGNWLSYGSLRANGTENFAALLQQNPEVADEVMDAIMLQASESGAADYTDDEAVDFDAIKTVDSSARRAAESTPNVDSRRSTQQAGWDDAAYDDAAADAPGAPVPTTSGRRRASSATAPAAKPPAEAAPGRAAAKKAPTRLRSGSK